MGLVVRKVQGGAEDRIRSLVADHAQSLEAGLTVLETSLRLGRTTIDVVALDAKQTLVLVVAGEAADEKMLVGTLDAYVWCLAHPESVQRRYPAASIAITRPPRVIFVAEQIPDTFMELVERLSVVPVECQELHTPNPTQTLAPSALPKVEAPGPTTAPSHRLAPAQIAAWLDAGLAQQRGSSVPNGSSAAVPAEPVPPALSKAEVPVTRIDLQAAGLTNGHSNGHVNGSANGHASAPAPAQPLRSPALAQAMRAAEGSAAQATKSPAPQPQPEPVAQPLTTVPPALPAAPVQSPAKGAATPAAKAATPAAKPATPPAPDAANHPALESLKFPKGGVSRQWQDFLDQLAAAEK